MMLFGEHSRNNTLRDSVFKAVRRLRKISNQACQRDDDDDDDNDDDDDD